MCVRGVRGGAYTLAWLWADAGGMENVEFKAELRDLALARTLCRQIKAAWVATLEQTDTYFRLAEGRLKRREAAGQATEWILYHRPDRAAARVSRFRILSQAQAELRFGASVPSVWVVVKKTRSVWMHSGVRIHLDQVEELGTFLELEALITPRQPLPECYRQVQLLGQAFAPVLGEVLSQSYSDMLAGEGGRLTIRGS